MEITIFLPTQCEIKNCIDFTVTAILKKLYSMIYVKVIIFQSSFSGFYPQNSGGYDSFISCIYNGQRSFLWTHGGVKAFLGVFVTLQPQPEVRAWGRATDPEPLDREFFKPGVLSSKQKNKLKTANSEKNKKKKKREKKNLYALVLTSSSLNFRGNRALRTVKSTWHPTDLYFSQKGILEWCIHPYFLKCAGERGNPKEGAKSLPSRRETAFVFLLEPSLPWQCPSKQTNFRQN